MKRINTLISDTESLIIFGAIILVTIICAAILNRYLLRKLRSKNRDMSIDITKFLFLKHILILTVYLVGIGWGLLILPITKSFAHSFLAGAGATILIIGLASQQILSNMISGVFIVLNKSFKINDIIEIQGNRGKVIEITWHDSIIENENKDRITIPNSLITSTLLKKVKRN
jgi:small-conductance mechanosensitive channel